MEKTGLDSRSQLISGFQASYYGSDVFEGRNYVSKLARETRALHLFKINSSISFKVIKFFIYYWWAFRIEVYCRLFNYILIIFNFIILKIVFNWTAYFVWLVKINILIISGRVSLLFMLCLQKLLNIILANYFHLISC